MIQSRKRRAFYKLHDRSDRRAKTTDADQECPVATASSPRQQPVPPAKSSSSNSNGISNGNIIISSNNINNGGESMLPPSVRSRSERSRSKVKQHQTEQQKHKYFCHQCNVGFQRQKNLREHLEGRKHKKVVSEWEQAAADFAAQVPKWGQTVQPTLQSQTATDQNHKADSSSNTNTEPGDNTIGKEDTDSCTPCSQTGGDKGIDVRSSWRKDEFRDFPHRSSCIDHSLLISTLGPRFRARFWRYLRDVFGKHYPEFPAIFHFASVHHPQYMRVKELFENLEAFRIVSRIVLLSEQSRKQKERAGEGTTPASTRGAATGSGGSKPPGTGSQPTIDVIYDLACGHGLLGILLAYRFPTKKVVCVDLEERKSFYAFRDAFVARGEKAHEAGGAGGPPVVLSNLEYRTADLRSVGPGLTPSSCLVAVHACNEANKHVVDLARAAGATWAVMPCCIRSSLYLNGVPVAGNIDSQVRYQLLCGAFAQAHGACLVRSVPRDTTARPILIAGGFVHGGGGGSGGGTPADDHHDGDKDDPSHHHHEA